MGGYQKHFEKRLEALKAFQKKEKRWPTLYSNDKNEKSLGLWCHKLRLSYNRKTLDKDRIKLLAAIGLPLTPMADKWKQEFELLKAYIKKHRRLPPVNDGIYMFSHRSYKGFNRLSAEKKKQLTTIGFLKLWTNFSDEGRWKKNFKALRQFVKTHGQLPTRKYNKQLEYWVNAQRQRIKKGQLEEEKLGLFKKAGIDLLQRSYTKNRNR